MVTKTGKKIIKRMPNKKITKEIAKPKAETKKKQRYIRLDNVDNMKAKGYKLAKEQEKGADLVLMEK